MRVLVLAAAALFVLPAAAQTRLTPTPGALAVSGGRAGEAMRVTTVADRPAQSLSARYRGITVNRSPRVSARGGRSGLVLGNVAMPTLRTPQADYVRRGNSAFRVVRGR